MDFDVIVIGSGFGGAITACRLAEANYRVLVLERGRRWDKNNYPRQANDMWIWNQEDPTRLNGWLDSNMGRFGFFRPYATWQGGVRPEPWHLSHAQVSVPALQVLSLDVLQEAIESADMPGKQTVLARLPELYQRYVLAIDQPV